MIRPLIFQLQNYLKNPYSNFEIIVAGYSQTVNQYPYGSYKILRSEFEQPHQNVKTKTIDEQKNLIVKTYYSSKTVIQLNFFNKIENSDSERDSLDVILEIAQKSWMWLNEDARDILKNENMVLSFTSPQITQEEKLESNDDICRVGFDFTIKKVLEHAKKVETINKVSIVAETYSNTDEGKTDSNTDEGKTDSNTDEGETDSNTDEGETDSNTDEGETDSNADEGETDSNTDEGETDSNTDEGVTHSNTDGN
jgi:hypothetical protein